MHYTDRYLKILFDAVHELGLDDANVIITADHGEQQDIREFNFNEAGSDFTGSFFDHGATLYNDEIKVPLLIKTQTNKPSVRSDYVSLVDLGTTILGMYKFDVPSWFEGVNLLADEENHKSDKIIASEGFNERMILRQDGLKYIRTYAPIEKRTLGNFGFSANSRFYLQSESLFNLKNDVLEKNNLTKMAPDKLVEMQKQYREYFGISEHYELIVDSPHKKPINIIFHKKERDNIVSKHDFIDKDDGFSLQVTNQDRLRIEYSKKPSILPKVLVDTKELLIDFTSLRLPIRIDFTDLPLESPGDYDVLSISRVESANFRKFEYDEIKKRQLAVGNPQFDRILRDWGYLNDAN